MFVPANVKEIFFFDRHFAQGLPFYKGHFNVLAHHRCIVEVSTTAFDHPQSPARVFETFGPNISFICPLRHPVERFYSLYLHYLRYGKISGSLQQACRQNPRILESSHYAKHIANWHQYFPATQIGYVFQEDLERDQSAFVRKTCDLLGLPYMPAVGDIAQKYNVTAYSKSRSLAGFAQQTADFMRGKKLYWPINAAKSIGLKRVIFGQENADAGRIKIPDAERAWLESELSGQIQALERLIGPVMQWRGQ